MSRPVPGNAGCWVDRRRIHGGVPESSGFRQNGRPPDVRISQSRNLETGPIGRHASSFLHQVLDIRNDYLHLHKKITTEKALECIFKLHLAVLGEYGIVPDGQGKARHSTRKDVEEMTE
jgi:hypothetical protein